MEILNNTKSIHTDEYNPVDRTIVKFLFGGLFLLSFLCSFLGKIFLTIFCLFNYL